MEEGFGGVKFMIEVGVLENLVVDVIVGLYLWNDLFVGMVGIKLGLVMVVVEYFEC